MKLTANTVQGTLTRLAASKTIVYASIEEAQKDGFKSIGTGLLLRAAAGGDTEVWEMAPRDDGQFQLLLRSDYGYDPELRSATIERKVIAAAENAVETPYGIGTLVNETNDGSPVVAVMQDGVEKRFVMAKQDVTPIPSQERVSIRLEAKSPTDTSVKSYVEQYFLSAYGDKAYASELAKTFGETQNK